MLPAPALEYVCTLNVDLAAPMEMGQGRAGKRRIIPIIGGEVTGGLTGRILNLGADWQTIYHDDVADLDTRYALETDDGALIEVVNKGVRFGPAHILEAVAKGEDVDPSAYTMRTQARLETGDPRYDWVNRTLFIGTGARQKSRVIVDLYKIL
jgi:hypothetical protein